MSGTGSGAFYNSDTANSASTRQYIKFMPVVNQTTALTRFFGSTVDQVFQPGAYQPVNAYIGQYPSYYNATSDFYIIEPTDERNIYQLEPGMVSIDTTGTLNYALTYPDLVGYLSAQGANVTNQSRMFENNFYVWSPPIDIDKLTNYHQYYWFGDYTGSQDLPILTITSPINTYIGDGGNNSFLLPASNNNLSNAETIAAYVNSVKVSDITITGNSVSLPLTPLEGDQVVVTRLDDLYAAIAGQPTFDLTGLIDPSLTIIGNSITSGMRVYLQDTLRIFNSWSSDVGFQSSNTQYAQAWDEIYLSDQSDIHDQVKWDTIVYDTFMVDGVGDSIRLTPDVLFDRDLDAQYITIDRSSLDRNPWSMTNNWVHKDSFAWANKSFPLRQAERPIIEFIRDLLLYNYGTFHIDPVDGVLSTPTALANGADISFAEITGQPIGTVTVDAGIKLFSGMRLLVAQKTITPLYPNQQIYLVEVVDGGITLTAQTQALDNIVMARQASGYGPAGIEMYYDGASWKLCQKWQESDVEKTDPLFRLFDLNSVSLDDPTTYLNSTFAGSRIFGYALGNSINDTILLRPLQYDNNGDIIFENDVVTRRAYTIINSNENEITGLYCYETIDNTVPVSLWHLTANPTTQDVITLDSDGNAYYSIPLNLSGNPQSDDVTFINKSQWLFHFDDELSNQIGFTGSPNGDNNWRDTLRDLSMGDEIMQHEASLLKLMLLAVEPNFDYFAAVRFADQEYNLYRNKFARKLTLFDKNATLPYDATTQQYLDAALAALKLDRNATFPFALSTMAAVNGVGQWYIPETPTFLGLLPSYQPMLILDDTYPTPVLMIQGHDGSLTPAFNDWRDDVFLAFEQQIANSIQAHFQTANTVQPNIATLERPLFDLEYYMAGRFCPSLTGAFANTASEYTAVSYNRADIQDMLAPIFARWSQIAGFDYRTNGIYDENNPFTWNYRGLADRYGTAMPGHWKAIYRWYFDTVRPHSHPWEMLGFTNQPIWWVSVYGAPPYTSANTALWQDLEAGFIQQGPRAGVNIRYARPGLSKVIPVNSTGKLLDPVSAGIIPVAPNYSAAVRNWVIGDGGPVENIWITSPAYRFALAQLAMMMKPARLVEMVWDSVNYGFSAFGDQWIDFRTLQRPSNADNLIHGETIPATGALNVVYGIQQWIVDYMISSQQSPSLLGNAIRGLDVRLIHRMASFLTTDNLSAVSDNFGVVPSEDTQVILYTSPATATETYSGVIVEYVGSGWRVVGYDARTPSFNIIPPDTNGPRGIISLATTPEPVILDWTPNTYYRIDQLVTYKGYTWSAITSHVSGPTFEQTYWSPANNNYPQAPRVINYLNGLNTIQPVPYGTKFQTLQEVADFLLGYERWLLTRGWTFNVMASDGSILNWTKAVVDFLSWTQVQWAPGNFIALSPGAEELHFERTTGTVLNVENNNTGYFGLLDRSGAPIPSNTVLISRLDSDLSMIAKNADIFAARVRVVDIEHALVFDNITIFNDNIYLPLFNMRQARLKILGNRTSGWVGRLEAPGFIVEGNSLAPSFDRNVTDIQEMFDIELSLRKNLTDYARHLIAYDPRVYMENLLLAEVEQFEFYQGMIQQKGTPGVFSKLLRSSRVSNNSNIEFLEEYAFRISRFGGPLDPRITFQLQQSTVVRDPQFIRLGNFPQSDPTWIIMSSNDTRWLDKPNTSKPFFSLLPPPDPNHLLANALPSAGPVRLNETDYQFFYLYELNNYYTNGIAAAVDNFTTQQRIWIYEDANQNRQYNVYEVFELGTEPNYLTNTTTITEDTTVQGMRLFFEYPIGLTTVDQGKTILVDGLANSTPEIQGIQTITVVNTVGNWIEIGVAGTKGFNFANATITQPSAPNVRIFQPVRFSNTAALHASPLLWSNGDLAWIDYDSSQIGPYAGVSRWAVYQYNTGVWTNTRVQPPRVDPNQIIESMVYDLSTNISNSQITVNNPIIDDLIIIDPLSGKLPGVAKREIQYQSEFDPAKYSNSFFSNPVIDTWGEKQVGQVWWDISTVRYLDPYTDQIGITAARDENEINYRSTYWAQIAPDTSVDIYEWTKSDVAPTDYITLSATDTTGSYTGTVYNAASGSPSFVQTSEWSSTYGKDITYYYFWVSGLTTVPNVPFRKSSISDIATILQNPTAELIPWFAPIMQDGMLVSGLMPYLNDTSTVLKVQTTSGNEDQGHAQWMLMRPNDETSLPPDWMWRAIVNGLSAFDEAVNPLPNPSLAPSRAVGINQGQNVFKVDRYTVGDRIGLLAARESFVGMVNNIFAETPIVIDRAAGVTVLSRNTPINGYLIWNRPDDSYVIEPPPVNEWDYQVYSFEERNRLMFRPEFKAAIDTNTTLRVLVNGNALPKPQWSIWWFNPLIANSVLENNSTIPEIEALYNNADTIFTLGTSYDVSVTTYAERNALTNLITGTRVYVSDDETADGFWVVYQYEPNNINADNYGFVTHRVQSYCTSDFFSIVDWYDQSFDNGLQTLSFNVNNPPSITYASQADLIASEGQSNPANIFVQISNSITGDWSWQYFVNPTVQTSATVATGWQTVAIRQATIALSSNLYNSTLDVHAVNTISTETIYNRDGSWEIKVLADAMRGGGALLDLEINELLFSMVHFIHSQQDDVDWIFKTSFMVIAGYAIPLQQPAILTEDVSNSLTSYIDEVKPYHVKIRDYISQYTPDIDVTNIYATDFDKPVYFDNTINSYRILNPNVSTDLSLLQTVQPWSDWYSNYNLMMTENSNGYWSNPVRHMNISILFDRVTDNDMSWDEEAWDMFPYDVTESAANTALGRIVEYYNPLPGMANASDTAFLINSLFRYPAIPINAGFPLSLTNSIITYDGLVANANPNSITLLINPEIPGSNAISKNFDPNYGHYDINRNPTDLFVDSSRPQERVALVTDDSLIMTVNSNGSPGAPPQLVRSFDMFGPVANAVLSFSGFIPQSKDGILVYLDGLRANAGSDYVVDYFGKKITLLTDAGTASIRCFGFAGHGGIVEQYFITTNGQNDITLTANVTIDQVQVIANGVDTTPVLVNNTVSLSAFDNDDIAIIVWDTSVTNTCQVQIQNITLTNGITSINGYLSFPLLHPDTKTIPPSAGTIVEVNGARLTPPLTYYGQISKTQRYIEIDFDISFSTITDLMIDGIYYANVPIPRWDSVTTDGFQTGNPFNLIADLNNYPVATVPGRFVLYDRYLISIDPTFTSKDIMVVFYEANNPFGANMDYQVLGNSVLIAPQIVANAVSALVTTFSNADLMKIKTHTYFASMDSSYRMATTDIAYTMVTFDGRMLTPEIDYDFASIHENGFDKMSFGDVFDEQYNASVMTIPLDPAITNGWKPIVAMLFTGQPAEEPMSWRVSTTTPAFARMQQALTTGGWDDDYFDAPFTCWDEQGDWLFNYPHFPGENTNPVQVYTMDNSWEFINQNPLNAGTLANALQSTDNAITISLNLTSFSPKLWPIQLTPSANGTNFQWTGQVFSLPDQTAGIPGVVWVGGERIEYFTLDYDPASYATLPDPLVPPRVLLSALRRGTRGTSIANVHAVGSAVTDGTSVFSPLAYARHVSDRLAYPRQNLI